MEQLQKEIDTLRLLLDEIDEMLEASIFDVGVREMIMHAKITIEKEYLDATAKLGTWGQLLLYRANKEANTGPRH